MGYPINSIRDDIYFAVKPGTDNVYENVFISSDRASDCCLDLFYVTKTPPPVVAVHKAPVKDSIPASVIITPEVVAVKEERNIIPDVYFAVNEWKPLETSYTSLDKLVAYLKEHVTFYVEIGGHTDSTGNVATNRLLSENRAKSVVDYLISKGIAAERLTYKGYGASVPVAPNSKRDGSDNPEGRTRNRRTEYTIWKR
nr:OmpA family protein [Filimonas lacunae]